MLSKFVLKRTALVALFAATASISISTGIRFIAGIQSDTITIIVRIVLPFIIAIPIGLFWFSRLEKLEQSYRKAVRRANELVRIASVDPLTGVLNRRSFIQQFEAANAAGVNGWFLLADIDYLKTINDRYGHIVGDDAVIAVAQALLNELPLDSLIARVGGDEFCAFVPKSSSADIEGVISKLNAAAAAEFRTKQADIDHCLSLSVGRMASKSNQKFKDIMSLADAGMYRRKRAR